MRRAATLVMSIWSLIAAPAVFAAETTDPVAMETTVVVLAVDAGMPLEVSTSFRERPPTVTVQFPPHQVVASIPEQSTVAKGAIQTIAARYAPTAPSSERGRFLDAIQIVLSAPYTYRVRSEMGRIVVEVDHPASVGTTAVEVGLRGGTIIEGAEPRTITQRFRAMQDALTHATPASWTIRFGGANTGRSEDVVPTGPSADGKPSPAPPAAATLPATASPGPRPASPDGRGLLIGLLVALAASLGAWRVVRAGGGLHAWWSRRASTGSQPRIPSGVILIDQLVWRAFERQGYQLIMETELTQPPLGTLRVMAKEGAKRALLFVGHGPFFEKQTVERFSRAMRKVSVEEGCLVAAGSFTVPAQRIAKEHRITLIGREQLTELLSAGAGSEYFTKQLEQQHARLEDAKETLRQYTSELDTLRRQRNEASWYLGEERARSAKLEAQLEEFHQQLRCGEADLQRWQEDAASLRKQWEESEWYLGESRDHVRHLESQLTALEPAVTQAEEAQRSRQEIAQLLEEERRLRTALETQLAEFQRQLLDVAARERVLQETVAQLTSELSVFRMHGERRRQLRVEFPHASVELRNGKAGVVWSGIVRDLSRTGIGVDCEEELPALPWFRVRVTMPGREPIESKAQVRWQQADGQPLRYRSGCKFVGISPATRAAIDQAITST